MDRAGHLAVGGCWMGGSSRTRRLGGIGLLLWKRLLGLGGLGPDDEGAIRIDIGSVQRAAGPVILDVAPDRNRQKGPCQERPAHQLGPHLVPLFFVNPGWVSMASKASISPFVSA